MIDWAEIKTIDDLDAFEGELYDEAPDIDVSGYELMPGLSEDEIKDAMFWKDYIRGLILLTGMPGQGKDMLAHMVAYKQRQYFGKVVISDSRPRKLFGKYIPFSQDFLVDQLDRMREVATGIVENQDPEVLPHFHPHITSDGRWISSRGEVFLRKSIILLDEFGSKYMYRREPHQPIKRALLKMFTIWRHLQCVVLGIGTEKADFDASCYPKVTCEMRCTRLPVEGRLIFGVTIHPLKYISATGELEYAGKKKRMLLDGDEARECLGGYAWKDLYNSENPIALEAPKSMRKRRQ